MARLAYGATRTSTRCTSSRLGSDRKKRAALLHQIQQIIYDRVRIAPIYEYIWPSGIGPGWQSRR